MPRLSLDLPESLPFVVEQRLDATHCNAHHLDNLKLLALVTEVRERLWQSLGYPDGDHIEGLGIILADVAALYRSEAFPGEVLHMAMTCTDFNSRGCDVVWRATERDSGREVARGKWGLVFFDYAGRRVASLPPAFRAHFA